MADRAGLPLRFRDYKYMMFDVVVIGSGAAGLTLSLDLARRGLQVAVLSKGSLTAGSTMYAQGGIAAVIAEEDSVESHIADTIAAGAGLCDPDVVRFMVMKSKEAIDWLVAQGVGFTQAVCDDGRVEYHLTREGGHSCRRILHAEDATGREIESALVSVVKSTPNIHIFEESTAIDLIKQDGRCVGAYVLNNETRQVDIFHGKFVVLATGGASKVYLYTSNPDGSTGDGIAMAYRAGCSVSNMEFNQFHPTCLYHPKAKSFLITEAVRGEGGFLLMQNGKRFMQDFDPRGELAPRDVVARAIDYVMKRFGSESIYLDISHKPKSFIVEHFPNVYAKCLEYGFDITKGAIPVVPAAHYTCGGVVVDTKARTNIPGLYAIGEVSCTGFHGANRMASNSLLEGVVCAREASNDIFSQIDIVKAPALAKAWDASQVTDSDEEVVITHNWHELRSLMWDYVGIVRTNKRLARAANRISLLKVEMEEYYGNFRVTKDLLELRNMVLVADIIVDAAKKRKENIGLHYNLDNIR